MTLSAQPATRGEAANAIVRYVRGVQAETGAPVRARRLYAWLENELGIAKTTGQHDLRALLVAGRLERVDEDGNVVPFKAGSGATIRGAIELYYRVPA